jgi:hypothetical protein
MIAQLTAASQNGTYKEFRTTANGSDWMQRDHHAGDGRPSLLAREQLLRAILAMLSLDREAIAAARFVPWSSATFEGARHIWTFAVNDEAERICAAQFCATAAEHEWSLQGAFVADLVASLAGDQLIVEVLTVLER